MRNLCSRIYRSHNGRSYARSYTRSDAGTTDPQPDPQPYRSPYPLSSLCTGKLRRGRGHCMRRVPRRKVLHEQRSNVVHPVPCREALQLGRVHRHYGAGGFLQAVPLGKVRRGRGRCVLQVPTRKGWCRDRRVNVGFGMRLVPRRQVLSGSIPVGSVRRVLHGTVFLEQRGGVVRPVRSRTLLPEHRSSIVHRVRSRAVLHEHPGNNVHHVRVGAVLREQRGDCMRWHGLCGRQVRASGQHG